MKLQGTFSLASLLLIVAVPESALGFRSLFRRRRPHAPNLVEDVAIAEPVLVAPAKQGGVSLDLLPDLDGLFAQIQSVSPLAKLAIDNEQKHGGPAFDVVEGSAFHHDAGTTQKGFAALPASARDSQQWKTIESSRRGPVTKIERIDNFNGLEAPLIRIRATLDGPCEADPMASFIMDLDQRSKWDIQIDDVYEAHTFHDLAAANAAMGFAYGDCSRLGVGYCRTKKNLGFDSREQLTVCGINKFSDGSAMIWGVELDEKHDDLMPSKHPRVTRAKSHLFSTTLVPTGESSFDVEYTLQLEIGGKIPTWLTTPIVTDSVKRMFKYAKEFYAQHETEKSSTTRAQESLLLTP